MMRVLDIDGRTWTTPLTSHAGECVGTARLQLKHARGTYHHEGACGYDYWRTKHWLPVVGLQQREGRRWKTWMVDDPLHWHAMREAVNRLPAGHVLVAGLGLGLMLHHMSARLRFESITVVEQNADVVALISPTLPSDPRVRIVVDDFYRYIARPGVFTDAVLWDLAVGTPRETWADFLYGAGACYTHLPDAALVQFGLKEAL